MKSGSYSFKSEYLAWKEMLEAHITAPTTTIDMDWIKCVWSVITSPKIKFFFWKLFWGALPIGANLATRGLSASSACPHYGQPETALHLFFYFPLLCKFGHQRPSDTPLMRSPISHYHRIYKNLYLWHVSHQPDCFWLSLLGSFSSSRQQDLGSFSSSRQQEIS